MTFAQPIWLAVGAGVCAVLCLLFVRAAHKRRAAVRLLAAASPTTSVALHRRILRDALALAGVALTFIALARPLGRSHLEAMPTRGVDLMFAVDTSKSMRASDIRPDRLTRAKLAVEDLAKSFDGARLGLIAFAGDAFVQAPMTADRGVFIEAVDALDTDVIPRGGTDLAAAIHAAEQAMASEPEHHKVLVLLSDGEDLAGSAISAARDAASRRLTIYTVGVGSEEGSLIELTEPDGHKDLVRDEAGNPVHSHLDERTLRAIAQVTGGAYAPLGADGRGLATIYADARAKLPTTTATGMQRRVYAERYAVPLALALACLLAELVVGDRRRRSRSARIGRLALATLLVPAIAGAAPVGDYNAGTSAYRKGDFSSAEKQFEAALHTRDLTLQANAYYDLGNARYREGQATLAKQDRDATIADWKQALAAYDAALALVPNDDDAKFNREFVAKKLAELEAQKEQEQQGKGQQQNKQNGRRSQNQSGQGQQAQNQNGQGQQAQNQNGQGQQAQNQNGQGQQNKQNGQGQQAQNQNGQGQQSQNQSGQGQQQNNQNSQGQQSQSQNQNTQGQQSQKQSGQGQQNKQNGQGQSQDQSGQGQQSQSQNQNGQGQQSQLQNQNGQGQQPQNQNGEGQQQNNQNSQGQSQDQSGQGQKQQPNAQGQRSQNQNSQGQQQNQEIGESRQSQGQDKPGDGEQPAQSPQKAQQQQSPSAPDAADRAEHREHQPIGVAGGAGSGSDRQAAADQRADAARRAAGQLTRGEAVQLLDSLQHDLKPMPIRGERSGKPTPTPIKDW